MNRRGEITTGYVLTWIIFTSLMLIVIFGSMFFLLDSLLYPPRNPFPAEASLIENRILFSTDGFAAVDPSGRPLPGVLDAAKLSRNLDDTIKGTRLTAAKVTVGAQEYYYDRTKYSMLESRIGFKGRGGAQQLVQKYVLLVKSSSANYLAPVTIEVLGEGIA